MKTTQYHWLLTGILMIILSSSAYAEEKNTVSGLMHKWAKINYLLAEDDQEKAFSELTIQAHALAHANPNKAEPMIWEAIIKSTYAGAKGGLGALSLMKEARDLLFAAEKINPTALEGSIYTSLGSFYYMVPGWLISFGDDDKALKYLQKGLKISPDNMDANYFMGDYWLKKHKYKKATTFLEKVVNMADVANRPVYSKGRKAEATEKLAKIRH